jgi:polysaccharide biosynthesis transport protein
VGLDPLLVGVLALCGGLLLGAALATMLERLDNGFRTSNDVTACADMRCLGLVPELPPSDPLLTAPDRPALSTAQVMFDEAVRLVASSIGLFGAGHGGGGRVVLVTSAVPGEGRSTLCAGLARSLSLAGRRVLLIDGLPRRFDQTEPGEPTVTPETAEGTGALQQMPQTKPDEGALVLLQRNSAAALSIDVFGSPHLAPALEQARKHFDVIIIEGPPVMLVADALVLGRMADTVVHVARWADTKRRTVLGALRRMQDHNVVVDGVVLTRVDVDKHAKLNLGDQDSYNLRRNSYYDRNTEPAKAHFTAVTHERASGSPPSEDATHPKPERSAAVQAHG